MAVDFYMGRVLLTEAVCERMLLVHTPQSQRERAQPRLPGKTIKGWFC